MKQINISLNDELYYQIINTAERQRTSVPEFCRQIFSQVVPKEITSFIYFLEKYEEIAVESNFSCGKVLIYEIPTPDSVYWHGSFKSESYDKNLLVKLIKFRIPTMINGKIESHKIAYAMPIGVFVDRKGTKIKFVGVSRSPFDPSLESE
jgi:hypothetical protein